MLDSGSKALPNRWGKPENPLGELASPGCEALYIAVQ